MRTSWMFVQACLLLGGVACGKGGDIVDPDGNGGPAVLDGLALSAQVAEVVHQTTSVKQITIQVTLRNTTNQQIVRSYPAGCPVLMRFYNPLDLALSYDEGRRECTVTTPVEIRLDPQEATILTSGLRFPWEILGDSLASGAYFAAALLRIVGANPVEIDAGTYVIPHCEQSGTGTICN